MCIHWRCKSCWGEQNNTVFTEGSQGFSKSHSPSVYTQPANMALRQAENIIPDLLESFGLQCSGQMSSSLTCGGGQEAEPSFDGFGGDCCWGQRLGHLTQSAQPQSLWQVMCLSNPVLSCSKTSIHHSFCMWCTRNLTCSWLPQSSLAQGHETEAYSLSLLLPTAALAPHRALAKHHGCVAAAEGAASHQGDQFLLQVHRIPAPGKEALGEQAGVVVP